MTLAQIEAYYEHEKTHLIKMTDHQKSLVIELFDNWSIGVGNEGDEYFFETLVKQLEGTK